MKKYLNYLFFIFLFCFSLNVHAYGNWAIGGMEYNGFRTFIKGHNYNIQTTSTAGNSSYNYFSYMLLCVEPNSFDSLWVADSHKAFVDFSFNQTSFPCSYSGSEYTAGRYFELMISGYGQYGIWFRPSRDISIEVKSYELYDTSSLDTFKWRYPSSSVNTQEIENKLNTAEKTRKGILKTLIDLPKNIVNLFIDGFKKLFIPSSSFFKDKFTELNEFFTKKLGILFYPFELFNDFIDLLFNFMKKGDGILKIPDIREPFSKHILIHSVNYNLGNDFKTLLGDYYVIYEGFMYSIIFLLFINFLRKYWKDIVEGS